MSTTLSNGSTTITLPTDLLWPDEFTWQPVQSTVRYTITGAIVIEEAAKQAGRPITLQGGPDYGWTTRDTVTALRAMAGAPGVPLTLVYRGATYTVAFDRSAGGFSATPVVDYDDPVDSDFYIATLRFITL